ncbi:hypothetical protein LTR95_008508 [Oleoguttula sp. CCFEE 5521]
MIPQWSEIALSGWLINYELLKAKPNAKILTSRTIVFVHGTPWSSAMFRPIAAVLHEVHNCNVLLYDLGGYGASQTLESTASSSPDAKGFHGSTSVRTQADILTALLKHLDLTGSSHGNSPHVIAHDIAGAIALRAHLLNGARYASLMCLDTNVTLPWGDGFYKLCRSESQVFTHLPGPIYELMLKAVVRSACVTPHGQAWEPVMSAPWLDTPESAGSTSAQSSFVRQIAQADDRDVAEMLEKKPYSEVGCLVRVLWGEQDAWIPREKMEKMAGMLGSKLDGFVVVPEAGHLVMLDQPERVTAEVVKWVGEQT